MLRQSIEHLARELSSSKDIKITRMEIEFSNEGEPTLDYLSSLFSRNFHISLPSELRELLTFPPECAIAWQYKSKGEFIEGGEFRLINLFDAFDTYRTTIDQNAFPANVPGQTHAAYFDFQPEIGNSIYALLIGEENEEFSQVYLYDSGRVMPMIVGVKEYIELLAITKGFYYWQYLFCEIDWNAYEFGYQRACIRNMMRVLPRLFAGSDFGVLYERMQEVGE